MTSAATTHHPHLVQHRADTLMVDPTVQRALDTRRADRMAADLRMDALGAITVSRRADGTHHIIDGQHRVAAVLRAGLGDELLPCLQYEGLTRTHEAGMFIRLNESKQIQAVDRFRIRVVEEDPIAVALNTALLDNGWRLGGSHDGCFSAVSALENVYRGAGVTADHANLDTCRTLLSMITTAFGDAKDGGRKEIVAGLGLMLLRHRHDMDLHKVAAEMAKYPGGPLGLVGRAKGLRELQGGNVADSMAEVLINLHNKGRRSRRLPEWRTAATPHHAPHGETP